MVTIQPLPAAFISIILVVLILRLPWPGIYQTAKFNSPPRFRHGISQVNGYVHVTIDFKLAPATGFFSGFRSRGGKHLAANFKGEGK
jgi:hypothetical protein